MKKSIVIPAVIIGGLIVVLPLAFKFLLVGFHSTSEVPEGDELWGGYEAGREYAIQRDVFLMPGYGGMAKRRLALAPEGSFGRRGGRTQTGPDTIAEYEADPEKAVIQDLTGGTTYKMNVVGIVRKGTRLRMTRLEHHKGWSLWFGDVHQLTPWAEILDGEHAGKEVDIDDISENYWENNVDVYMHKPEAGLISPNLPTG